eukprot:CAMPEP_0184329886 /NCGR_PEP_ID=MMETSP1049-20130417/144386_1 /TAXON_ID=77928 /ORGANISM="Proteomonas sulcata, Strain CCMP704" /LENGTH=123 /DNA_ID=CAMNT_0026652277 /DNA_START=10 /DNA_END=381 /DNA_ORIENTATION=-
MEFVYGETLDFGEDIRDCMELLHCAAYLQVQPLMRACGRRAEGLLSSEVVAEVWEAAHTLELDRLKSRCLRFIIENYDACRPEKEPTIKETMKRIPAFFDVILSALAPGQGAATKLGKKSVDS